MSTVASHQQLGQDRRDEHEDGAVEEGGRVTQVAVTAAGLHAVHLLLALVLLPSAESDAHEVDIAAVLDHLLSAPFHSCLGTISSFGNVASIGGAVEVSTPVHSVTGPGAVVTL